jgi:hypothetical protein
VPYYDGVNVSAAGNLTVDGISTSAGVTLSAGGALTEVAGAALTLGGSYTATALTMNQAAEQPMFTAGSFGSLSLTFNQSGSAIDLTGVPLSAPSSVTVRANNENLTVDSITAGSNVTLFTPGVIAAASGAIINLSGSYSVTASSPNTANHAILQPMFGASSSSSVFLTFTQSGGPRRAICRGVRLFREPDGRCDFRWILCLCQHQRRLDQRGASQRRLICISLRQRLAERGVGDGRL